jgi:hypothetical protein
MTRPLLLAGVACALSLAACAIARPAHAQEARTLQPFRDDAEIAAFHQTLSDERERRVANISPPSEFDLMNRGHTYMPPPPPPAPPAGTPRQQEPPVSDDWAVRAAQQTAGDARETMVMAGEHLVVLRRGRLFTLRAGGDTLHPISAVEAAGFPVRGATHHDELLVWGEHVVVISSSMQRDGTELGIFRLAADGRLTHRATYSVTSGEDIVYHTYAARLIGGRLVLYAPLAVRGRQHHRPALHRWDADEDSATREAPATRVYRPAGGISETDGLELHTVAVCDLADDDLRCQFTGLYAPPGRALHVSSTAVYVWAGQGGEAARESVLYRMPLDGSAPTALRVSGTPADPSAFMESADGHLHVLVQAEETRTQASGAVYISSRLALLRVPLSELGDGSRTAAPERYTPLPGWGGGDLRSGYVGDWLIYGGYAVPWEPVTTAAVAVRWADGGGLSRIELPHAFERVQALGSGAVVLGQGDGSVHLSTLRLGPDTATLVDRHTVPDLRFLHMPDVVYREDGRDTGVLALPVRGPQRPRDAPWLNGPGGIRFLRNQDLRLEQMGELASGAFPGDDGCLRSCRDWFGETRAMFLRGRILTLLGYEVVEARENAGRVGEVRRASFAPAVPTADLSGEWAFYEDIGRGQGRYHCRNRGSLWLDRDGDSLAVRYRQSGECFTDGARTSSDGEGTGAGRLEPASVAFESGPCRHTAYLNTLHSMSGDLQCRMPMPDGSTVDVQGWWQARRSPP